MFTEISVIGLGNG